MSIPELACEVPAQQGPNKGKAVTGTYGGYRRHTRAGEAPCAECAAARSEYDRAYRRANLENVRAAGRRYHYKYRERNNSRSRAWQQANPERVRATALLRNYGITPDQFDAMLMSQGGVCAICGETPPERSRNQWHVDHDAACCPIRPTCGRCVRGILCLNCNQGLGKLGERNLAKALEYLGGEA